MGKQGEGERVGREVCLAPGVYARIGRTRSSLRIAFQYRGEDCRERLNLEPTPQNVKYASRLRGEILNAIERGTFNYADHFPASPRARRFGAVASDLTMAALFDDQERLRSTLNVRRRPMLAGAVPVFSHRSPTESRIHYVCGGEIP